MSEITLNAEKLERAINAAGFRLKLGVKQYELVPLLPRLVQPAADDQPANRITAAEAKKIATQFFYWWHNQPGSNAERGFDYWWAPHGAEYAAAPADDQARRDALRAEIINTPELANFSEAIRLEALHQRERWGSDHDDGKEPEDWLWLIGYLATKATQAARYGDREKYIHHIITCGAACLNWHAGATGTDTSMRVGPPIPAFEAASAAEGDGDA